MHVELFRCDHCGAERTQAPVRDDEWFELDRITGNDGWPRLQFHVWGNGSSATHLCSRACLRAWVDDFMEKQLEEKARGAKL